MPVNMFSRKKGFTLIELLVVIAVIGMLASIVLVATNRARGRGRDARRYSDMQQIYTALYSFYLDHGCLPQPSVSGCVSGYTGDAGGWDYSSQGGAFLSFLVPQYLPTVPVDPLNDMTGDASPSGTYSYRYYCYPSGTTGLHLGYWEEGSNGGYVIFSGIKEGDSSDWGDDHFVCR